METAQREENFKNWFNKSQATDVDGNPLMVYHGTLNNFNEFILNKTNPESYWGRGFYFSTSVKDVNLNYATPNGPDYKNKLSNLCDLIMNEPEEYIGNSKISYFSEIDENHEPTPEQALLLAAEKLGTEHEGVIIPAYLSLQNPLNEDTTWNLCLAPTPSDDLQSVLDYLDSEQFKSLFSKNNIHLDSSEIDNISSYFKNFCLYEAATDDVINWEQFSSYLQDDTCLDEDVSSFISSRLDKKFGEEIYCNFKENNDSNILDRYITFIQEQLSENAWTNNDTIKSKIIELIENKYSITAYDEINVNAQEFLTFIKDNCWDFYENDNGDNSFFEINRKFIVSEGYDGIIMEAHFDGMGIPEGTKHLICFESTQIKSAIGNNGEFSPENADILYRAAKKINTKHEIMPLNQIKETILAFNINMEHFGKFVIYDSVEDAKLKGALPKTASRNTKGFYHEKNNVNGKGYIGIIRDNIEDTNDLIQTYTHEAIGHYSVKEMLGDNYNATMLKLYSHYNRDYKSEFNPNNDNFFTTKQKINKAEEFLAVSIEKKAIAGFSGIRLLVGTILNKVRKFIPDLPITSFDTDYLEKAAFNFYKNNTLQNIEIAKTVKSALDGETLTLNVPLRRKNIKDINGNTI